MGIQTDLKNAIIARLSAIPEIGSVLDKYTYVIDQDKFLDQFAAIINGNREIRGWWVSIPSVYRSENTDSTLSELADTLDYPVFAVLRMSNRFDSETEFQDMIYSARDVLRSMVNWGFPEQVIQYSTEVTIPSVNLRQFGSVLVHFCEMHVQISVQTEIVWEV